MPKNIQLLFSAFYLLLAILISSCVPNAGAPVVFHDFQEETKKITGEISPNESVAISWVYDQNTGDITALGDGWRNRVETAFRNSGVLVKTRKDIGFIIDDVETYGQSKEERNIWKAAGAEIIVAGSYRIKQNKRNGDGRITIIIKALRVTDSSLVKTITWSEDLADNWPQLAARIKGNVFHKEIETVVGSDADKPFLKVKLDRQPACYPTGAAATIEIETEPGVHIYILNPAADNTVSILYPNSMMKDQPLPSRKFVFPPPQLAKDIQLLLFPLEEQETCRETFKVVASRHPIDFSFLPVPENNIFSGAKGGDMKKMLTVLKNSHGWSDKVLTYWVGVGCER